MELDSSPPGPEASEPSGPREPPLAQNLQAAQPVLRELADAGFEVTWVSDLYRKRMRYESAIPVLLRWLPRVANRAVKEEIVRALSVPWAKPGAAPALIEEFRRTDDATGTGIKWAIGNALSIVADDSVFGDIVHLVRDRGHGRAREMLAVALGNMKDPAAVDCLIELLDDTDTQGHALIALGKLRAEKARPRITQFLDHSKAWVRQEARRALTKLNKTR